MQEQLEGKTRIRRGLRLFLVVLLVASVELAGSAYVVAASPNTTTLQLAVQVGSGAGAPGAATIGVSAAGQSSACTAACNIPFAPGAKVTLTVQTAAGYVFDHWSGPGLCSAPESPVCSFTMPAVGADVVAVLRAQTSTLTVVPGSAGTISGGLGSVACTRTKTGSLTGACAAVFPTGTTVKLTVKPALGKHFVRWSIWQCRQALRTCDVPVDADTTVVALIDPVRLTVDRSGLGGKVSTAPRRLDCTAPCRQASANFPLGTFVTLTAIGAPGAGFSGWGAPCGGPAPGCSLSLFADVTVSAAFGAAGAPSLGPPTLPSPSVGLLAPSQRCGTPGYGSYSFNLTVGKGGSVSFTAPGSCALTRCSPTCSKSGYTQFDQVHVTAHAQRGYRFFRWRNGCQRGPSCSLPVFGHSWIRAFFRHVHRRQR